MPQNGLSIDAFVMKFIRHRKQAQDMDTEETFIMGSSNKQHASHTTHTPFACCIAFVTAADCVMAAVLPAPIPPTTDGSVPPIIPPLTTDGVVGA